MIEQMPLVGRVRVLDRMVGRLAASDEVATFVLAGPAGVGKTRVLIFWRCPLTRQDGREWCRSRGQAEE